MMATAKHFAAHGQPEGGTNVGPGNFSERVVREYFLKPFEAAVKQGHVETVMASYNEIDGIPSHSNKHLLDDILRHEWGFDGMVVSDYFGIDDLIRVHHVVATNEEAAKLSLEVRHGYRTAVCEHLSEPGRSGASRERSQKPRLTGRRRVFFGQSLWRDCSKILLSTPTYAEKITNSPSIRHWR